MRTYTVQVGKMPEAIRLYSQFGYPALHKLPVGHKYSFMENHDA
jgi:hypothetical protein